ncbi:MAG: hypothetical protein ACAI44_33350, partial [Candidatus Sericytochromatia bacterium]
MKGNTGFISRFWICSVLFTLITACSSINTDVIPPPVYKKQAHTDFQIKQSNDDSVSVAAPAATQTFASQVQTQSLLAVEKPGNGSHFSLELTTGQAAPGSIRIPAEGEFSLVLEGGGSDVQISDQDATDGEARASLPAQLLEGFIQARGTPGQSLTYVDPMYFTLQELNRTPASPQWFRIGKRPFPIPSDWSSQDGTRYVLRFRNHGVVNSSLRWYPASGEPDYPAGLRPIGPEGGTVALPGVGRIEIPAEALSSRTLIRMEQRLAAPKIRFEPTGSATQARDFLYASPVLSLKPQNLELKKPARLYADTFTEIVGRNHPLMVQWGALIESGQFFNVPSPQEFTIDSWTLSTPAQIWVLTDYAKFLQDLKGLELDSIYYQTGVDTGSFSVKAITPSCERDKGDLEKGPRFCTGQYFCALYDSRSTSNEKAKTLVKNLDRIAREYAGIEDARLANGRIIRARLPLQAFIPVYMNKDSMDQAEAGSDQELFPMYDFPLDLEHIKAPGLFAHMFVAMQGFEDNDLKGQETAAHEVWHLFQIGAFEDRRGPLVNFPLPQNIPDKAGEAYKKAEWIFEGPARYMQAWYMKTAFPEWKILESSYQKTAGDSQEKAFFEESSLNQRSGKKGSYSTAGFFTNAFRPGLRSGTLAKNVAAEYESGASTFAENAVNATLGLSVLMDDYAVNAFTLKAFHLHSDDEKESLRLKQGDFEEYQVSCGATPSHPSRLTGSSLPSLAMKYHVIKPKNSYSENATVALKLSELFKSSPDAAKVSIFAAQVGPDNKPLGEIVQLSAAEKKYFVFGDALVPKNIVLIVANHSWGENADPASYEVEVAVDGPPFLTKVEPDKTHPEKSAVLSGYCFNDEPPLNILDPPNLVTLNDIALAPEHVGKASVNQDDGSSQLTFTVPKGMKEGVYALRLVKSPGNRGSNPLTFEVLPPDDADVSSDKQAIFPNGNEWATLTIRVRNEDGSSVPDGTPLFVAIGGTELIRKADGSQLTGLPTVSQGKITLKVASTTRVSPLSVKDDDWPNWRKGHPNIHVAAVCTPRYSSQFGYQCDHPLNLLNPDKGRVYISDVYSMTYSPQKPIVKLGGTVTLTASFFDRQGKAIPDGTPIFYHRGGYGTFTFPAVTSGNTLSITYTTYGGSCYGQDGYVTEGLSLRSSYQDWGEYVIGGVE